VMAMQRDGRGEHKSLLDSGTTIWEVEYTHHPVPLNQTRRRTRNIVVHALAILVQCTGGHLSYPVT